MSTLDVCATVGCKHRRDEHNTFQGCFAVMAGDGCLAFTEPPTVAEPSPLWCADDSPHAEHWENPYRSDRGNYCTGRPSVAEHDDNLDTEAIRARAERASRGPWRIPEVHRKAGNGQTFVMRPMGASDPMNNIPGLTNGREVAALVAAEEDAEFIAHARTDIPALLSALDAERAKNTEALALHRDNGYGRCVECVLGPSRAAGILLYASWPCKTVRILGGKD